MIRVRLAPSPTGKLHLGTARTALFNFLFARKNKGKFILRIEDTDRSRSTREYEKDIIENLKWLGFDWDEEVFRQTERLDIYQKYIQDLLKKRMVYKKEGAIWFKVPGNETIEFNDLIRGRISFETKNDKDFVIVKSDSTPLFMISNVIDDALMDITHIIRGEDHLSNTPRQILLQKALGFTTPKYAHLPLLLNPDRTKMSKRFGATEISEYRKMGYLPTGLINYLALLGWTPHQEQEIFTLQELIKKFNLKKIQKSPAVFYQEKLDWLNGEHLRRLELKELTAKIHQFGYPKVDSKMAGLIRERIKRLDEIPFWTDFFFKKIDYDQELLIKELKKETVKKILMVSSAKLANVRWGSGELKAKIKELSDGFDLGMREFLYPLRIAICGRPVSPPLFESMEILGKEEVLKRIKKAHESLQGQKLS